MTFGFPVGTRNFIRFFQVSWGDFVLHGYDCTSTVLPSFVPPRHIDDCFAVHFLHRILWSAVVKSPKSSALGTSVPVRRLQEALVIFVFNITIWVLRKVRIYTVRTRIPVPLLLAAPLEVHEMTWKCLDFPALGFSKALLKYFHQPNSP